MDMRAGIEKQNWLKCVHRLRARWPALYPFLGPLSSLSLVVAQHVTRGTVCRTLLIGARTPCPRWLSILARSLGTEETGLAACKIHIHGIVKIPT